jgi:DNA processing protein
MDHPENALPWLRLTLAPGFTLAQQHALLHAAGCAHAAAQYAPLPALEPLVERALRWLEKPGHHLVSFTDPGYPAWLRQIADPPLAIYACGRVELLDTPSIAIVGSRNATPQGVHDARAFAEVLAANGLCIVSGLARGIDAAAHRGGLAAPASTIAVFGTGIDRVYPRDHDGLAREIFDQGCAISELPLGMGPLRANFPRRNRLISGLARGTLVVEAGMPSGTLHTAASALEQGREVFAIPGSIHAPHSKGCHHLIREGAILVQCAQDILKELRIFPVAAPTPAGRRAHDDFLDKLGFEAFTVDEAVRRSGLDAAEVSAQLSLRAIDGRVVTLPGGRYQRVAA